MANKQLLIMRHAKSSWTETGKTDFERKLNKRGRRVAPLMADFLAEQGLLPDRIISSSAKRACLTTELFAERAGIDSAKIDLVKYLYLAPAEEYLELLERFDEPAVDRLMVVGHNPGLEELVYRLGNLHESMPTAAIAVVDLGSDQWIDIRPPFRDARVTAVLRPKELGIE